MKILIDGYNLIFECGLHGRKVNSVSLAKARTLLLQTIAKSFSPQQCKAVTVVFDAKKQSLSDQQVRELISGIEVLYAIDFDDADEMIESLIKEHSHPKQLTVVSSDHRIHKAALRRKAVPVDSDQWYDQLTESQPSLLENPPAANSARGSNLLNDEDVELFKKDIERDFGG